MKELIIMSCSTGFSSYTGHTNIGVSYVERLAQEFHCRGLWINGLTILHVFQGIKQFIRGNKRKVLIHVGAVEAFTYPAINFLNWSCHELLFGNMTDNPFFRSGVIPKMYKASFGLSHGNNSLFFRILETEEFLNLWMLTGKLLEGSDVLVMGMTKPCVPPAKDYMIGQAAEFNAVIQKACVTYNNLHYVDIWERTINYVQDSNHLNEEGHSLIYNTIRPLLED